MEWIVVREPTPEATPGRLYLGKQEICFTLEDPEREVKIQDQTAIPRGRYRVILSQSKRFGRIMPEVLNVPGFSGIRIHGGNTTENTDGCLLVGRHRDGNRVSDCAIILNQIILLLDNALKRSEEVWITYR